MIDLPQYAGHLRLADPFVPPAVPPEADVEAARRDALAWLVAERRRPASAQPEAEDADGAIQHLLTARRPGGMPPHVHAWLDLVMAARAKRRGAVAADEVLASPGPSAQVNGARMKAWRGDITRLATDAIVNAANADLLGCFVPGHRCIDNVIHNAAGPRLRDDCGLIMDLQGHPEPTGCAKVTRAYHLPSRFVLHTVGPIVRGRGVSPRDQDALASSYRSCLALAAAVPEIRSVAFCAISTGVFGYPKDQGARVAVETVAGWLQSAPGALDLVVFAVFSDEDARAYDAAFGGVAEQKVP